MLQSLGSQRIRQDLETEEQQQQPLLTREWSQLIFHSTSDHIRTGFLAFFFFFLYHHYIFLQVSRTFVINLEYKGSLQLKY